MRRQAIFLIFAAAAAGLAALMVHSSLKLREAEIARAQAQSVEIVVAARDLPLGSQIDQGSVKLARWSREALPPGAVLDAQTVINDYVRRELVANEPVTDEALFNSDKSAGVMPLVIPPGMRAMSVQVDEVSDIAGFVLPHARVDVLAALSSDNGQKAVSKIVLENVEVLAVAQEMDKEKDQPELVKVVTLLVKPDEAELLALASREGVLRLAMRSYTDQKLVETSGTDLKRLLSAYSPAAPAPRKAKPAAVLPTPVTVEIMRDGKAMHPAAFVNRASAEPLTQTQAAQWASAIDDTPPAVAQSPNPTPDQHNKPALAASGPPAKPQTSPSAPPPSSPPAAGLQTYSSNEPSNTQVSESGTSAERRTIEVDP